jgi:ketosteroid isomerase-like protein
MKSIPLLIALISLSLATIPFAQAQETETPTETPNAASPEKAETKKTEPMTNSDAEKSPASTDNKSQKKETAKTARGGETASTAAKPMAKGSTDAQLKDIEMRWEGAFKSHDVNVVEGILAENYVLTDEHGKVFNRRGAIKEFKNSSDTLEKASSSDVVVHPVNKDAAVVTGKAHEVGKDKSGKAFDRTFRWTDTFVNHNGKWECVASHVTLVSQK